MPPSDCGCCGGRGPRGRRRRCLIDHPWPAATRAAGDGGDAARRLRRAGSKVSWRGGGGRACARTPVTRPDGLRPAFLRTAGPPKLPVDAGTVDVLPTSVERMEPGTARVLPPPYAIAGARTARVNRERGATREERGSRMRMSSPSGACVLLVGRCSRIIGEGRSKVQHATTPLSTGPPPPGDRPKCQVLVPRGRHSTSATPARRSQRRAMTNSRSARRLR